MTKTQIKTIDALPHRTYCSVAVCHKGRSLARIDKAVLFKRIAAPVGFAWLIESIKGNAKVYMCPDQKVSIMDGTHFRIDI